MIDTSNEGKWDASSDAIQKKIVFFLNMFFFLAKKLGFRKKLSVFFLNTYLKEITS